jgi:hypothetical protein
LRITDAGIEAADGEVAAAAAAPDLRRVVAPSATAEAEAAAAAAAAAAARPQRHGPPSNSVWRPATPEQQRESLKGLVALKPGDATALAAAAAAAAAPAAGGAPEAAAAAASAAAAGSPADALAAAVAVAASSSDPELAPSSPDEAVEQEVGNDEADFAAAAASGGTFAMQAGGAASGRRRGRAAWTADPPPPPPPRYRARTPPELGLRSANAPRSPRLLPASAVGSGGGGGGGGRQAGRALQQLGGGGGALPPTTTAAHAAAVKVGACGLAEVTGGSSLASPAASGVGEFGWSISVNKGANVMAIGQPGASTDAGSYAGVVVTYNETDAGAAFVFAAVPGGATAVPIKLGGRASCSFADQRLVNPVWRVNKTVVGFGSEVAISFKGGAALASGRLIPDPAGGDDDGGGDAAASNYAAEGTDMVWAFVKGVTGYLQFSRQEIPLVNPPVGEEQYSDENVLRRVMALGLSFDAGLAMAAYVTVDRDRPSELSAVGGSVQIFGATKERYLLTQVIEPPQGSRAQSWSVAAAMSADSQTIVASDGSGEGTLFSDALLLASAESDDARIHLEDGSGVFVFARTDGLAVTKPDGKVGLVQANATARYTLAGLLRPPLWTEDLAPGTYKDTATFGTAVAVTAKGKFIAVVERRYVARPPATDAAEQDDDPGPAIAHFVHVYQRVDGTGTGLTAMYGLKCTLDDPDPLRFAPFGYGRHQLAIATDGKRVTVAVGSQPSALRGDEADLPSSVYVYRIVAGQSAAKGANICPFQPEFVVDDPLFVGLDAGGGAASAFTADRPSLFGEAVALSADGKVLVVGQPETMVEDEPGSVYLYDLRKPVKKDVYVGNAPLVGVGGYRRR